jgi:hypothetical protein
MYRCLEYDQFIIILLHKLERVELADVGLILGGLHKDQVANRLRQALERLGG